MLSVFRKIQKLRPPRRNKKNIITGEHCPVSRQCNKQHRGRITICIFDFNDLIDKFKYYLVELNTNNSLHRKVQSLSLKMFKLHDHIDREKIKSPVRREKQTTTQKQ